jgi:hypothetical protein
MFICRFVIFDLQESSKFLIAKGRNEEAIAVCHLSFYHWVGNSLNIFQVLKHIAKRNGKTITLTVEHLNQIDASTPQQAPKSAYQAIRTSFSRFSLYAASFKSSLQRNSNTDILPRSHVRPLFAGKRFAVNSTITILSWGMISTVVKLHMTT